MIVTQLSLAKYFDLIVERATYGGYKWIIMFIGRKAEAEKIYNEIDNCWASLNDLTNDRFAFVQPTFIHGITHFINFRIRNHIEEGCVHLRG